MFNTDNGATVLMVMEKAYNNFHHGVVTMMMMICIW